MSRSFKLFSVRGIGIEVDVSWLVIALLVTWSFVAELSSFDTGASPVALLLTALVGSALFFASVLAHELSHSLVAIRRGIRVRRIRLFIFGGVSEIEQEASTPQDELAVTVAGPASSFVLGGLFALAVLALPSGVVDRAALLLAVINVALGVFNLLPGFPLDGGRVLRALVWRVTGDYRKATRVAAASGRLLAAALVAAGFAFVVFAGDVFGLWWVAIGWFLFQAAQQSAARLEAQMRMQGRTAGDVMTPALRLVPGDLRLDEFVEAFSPQRGEPPLPVLADGRVRGLIGWRALRRVAPESWPRSRVVDAMESVGPGDVVGHEEALESAVGRLVEAGGRLLVVDGGRAVGVLWVGDVERLVRL